MVNPPVSDPLKRGPRGKGALEGKKLGKKRKKEEKRGNGKLIWLGLVVFGLFGFSLLVGFGWSCFVLFWLFLGWSC